MHMTDHGAARAFAVEWATKDSEGKIANLARAYLRVSADLEHLEERLKVAEARALALEQACVRNRS
jgi:hypothetical protein